MCGCAAYSLLRRVFLCRPDTSGGARLLICRQMIPAWFNESPPASRRVWCGGCRCICAYLLLCPVHTCLMKCGAHVAASLDAMQAYASSAFPGATVRALHCVRSELFVHACSSLPLLDHDQCVIMMSAAAAAAAGMGFTVCGAAGSAVIEVMCSQMLGVVWVTSLRLQHMSCSSG